MPSQSLSGIRFHRVLSSGNQGAGIQFYLAKLNSSSLPVDAEFHDCTVEGGASYGLRLAASKDGAMPRGSTVMVRNFTSTNTRLAAVQVTSTGPGFAVLVENARLEGCGSAAEAPLALIGGHQPASGVTFTNVTVLDSYRRPALATSGNISDVRGTVSVRNTAGCLPVSLPAHCGNNLTIDCHANSLSTVHR